MKFKNNICVKEFTYSCARAYNVKIGIKDSILENNRGTVMNLF